MTLWRGLQRAEYEFSAYNFEFADTEMFRHFADAEKECQSLLGRKLPRPAYDQCIKASHCFNLLDARGVISVISERASSVVSARSPKRAARHGSKGRACDGLAVAIFSSSFPRKRESIIGAPSCCCGPRLRGGDG